jgi:hypothetical protein
MLNKREFKIILIGKAEGKALDQNEGASVIYDGRKQVIKF